jgi:methionyl-tRNA synthetase
VYGQCKSWSERRFEPSRRNRDLDWCVPVPVDGADGKVLYVVRCGPLATFRPPKSGPTIVKWWKDAEPVCCTSSGKTQIVFHCIIFPAMLKAKGLIFARKRSGKRVLNLEGDKISTSRNWAVWLHEYLEEFPGKEDVLKYVLLQMLPKPRTTILPGKISGQK